MNNYPIHKQKVMNILAMCGFRISSPNPNVMHNKLWEIYFYDSILHKVKIETVNIPFLPSYAPIIEYTYSDKDILQLIEDIQ